MKKKNNSDLKGYAALVLIFVAFCAVGTLEHSDEVLKQQRIEQGK